MKNSNNVNLSLGSVEQCLHNYFNQYAGELSKSTSLDFTTSQYAVGIFSAVTSLALLSGLCYGVYSCKKQRNTKLALVEQAQQAAAEKAKEVAIQAEIVAKEQAAKDAEAVKFQQAYNAVVAKQSQNDQTLSQLGMQNWSIPLEGPDGKILKGSHQVKAQEKAVFNSSTEQMLSTVESMIGQSMETGGNIALPNLLIQGQKAVGKSMLVNELFQATSQFGAGYIRIPSKMFENHLVAGSHVTAFQQLLNVAKTSNAPVYFVIEDGEYLFKHRSKDSTNIVEARRVELVNAFLDLTGDDQRKVSILMTTRDPEVIDEAFNTRVMPIVLQRPGVDERRKIIGQLKDKLYGTDETAHRFFSLSRIEQTALKTDGFTCGDLKVLMENIRDCIFIKNGMDQGVIDSSIELLKNKAV